ncbi:hypothetical protein [Domibacillus indicus]|uniref:hypothetical protein n=1 Tax=Domibacillus indicus TaxID=1437523 RepID=UPI000696524F|nr:hypothetical protein [Domibacillus indicus]
MPTGKRPGYIERKVIAGALAGTLFFVAAAFLQQLPLSAPADAWPAFLQRVANALPVYMMYIMPVMLAYFVLASMISDSIARFLARKQNGQFEGIYALVFHLLFGMILLWLTVLAMLLFFVIDRILQKWRERYTYKHALTSLLLPLTVWFALMIIAFMKG